MNLQKIVIMLLAVLGALPALAQKGKNLTKTVDAVLSRQTAQQVLAKQAPVYHPVFGYQPWIVVSKGQLKPISAFDEKAALDFYEARLVQVAPLKEPIEELAAAGEFLRFELLRPAQLTQAFYMWRLSHPQDYAVPGGYYNFLQEQAQKVYQENLYQAMRQGGIVQLDQWPNLRFLARLINPNFTPTSYAQLYQMTSVYPQHIRLDGYGIPVKTVEASYAEIVDNYLMLSHPAAMGPFNNTVWGIAKDHGYTPFVLTAEEYAAADKLLELRREGEKLPANPTVRDLLQLAYNRLETHSVPYTKIADIQGKDYKTYPNYKNTQLYRIVKRMIKDQIPLESYHQGYYTLENVDMTHLIVLDAVMGGVDPQNLMEVRRALSAFDKLCADVHPKDKQTSAHLALLQQNLRVVFADLLGLNELKIDWATGADPRRQEAELANYAAAVLERPVRDLVGRNWKQGR